MLDPILREAIKEIIDGAILKNWLFYFLVAAVSLLSGVVGSFIGSYARKRGENLATKADFDAILSQLTVTTQATEDIKTSIQHSDWLSREWKVIRRTKLEELLDSAYACEDWLDIFKSKWLFHRDTEVGPDPADKVKRLAALYFPELRLQAANLASAQHSACSWAVAAGHKVLAVTPDVVAITAIMDVEIPLWNPHYSNVLRAISDVEDRAIEIMNSIQNS